MPSTSRIASARTLTLFSLLAASAIAHAAPPTDEMRVPLQKRAATYKGCYSSSDPLTNKGSYMYQSSGYCGQQCTGSAVFATSNGDECWCGDEIPADQVDDSQCNIPCTGFGQDSCGGNGFWSLYITGAQANVQTYGSDGSSSSTRGPSTHGGSATSTAEATVVTSTQQGQTVVVTIQPTTTDAGAAGSSSGHGTNTAGIAAGVVVGVIAIAGIIGGALFWIRRKKKMAAEEEYKQRTQVSDFMRGAHERKAPGTAYSGSSDQRLDPEAGRRNSVGSLADNQDYSRRILRVANPDSS